MDTRFLESFIAVVDGGSIAEAARRLNLTPSAIAKRIQALETEMGTRLISRAGRTAKPTEAAYAILESARQILRDTRGLKNLPHSDRPCGELRIGVIASAVTGILPHILDHLTQACPDLNLYVVPGISSDLHRMLGDDDVDAAIVVEPPFELGKEYDWMLLRSEPLVLITPASMPLAEPTELLQSEPFIRYDRHHWGGRLADGYLQQQAIRPRERFEVDALDAIAVLVDHRLGISLVPDWAPPWPEGVSLNKVEVDASSFARRIGLLWLRNSPNAHLVNAFRIQARTTLGL